MNALNTLVSEMLTSLRARLEEWGAAEYERLEAQEHAMALVGEPWIVRTDNFAYTVKGNTCYPVVMTPSLIGVSHYTRQDAEKVAALRGHECKISHCNSVRREMIEELKEMISQLTAIYV